MQLISYVFYFRQLVNHFEFHNSISTKDNLIKNLKNYC